MRCRAMRPAVAGLALACAATAQAGEDAVPPWSGELRAHLDPRSANAAGPLAEAAALAPELVPLPRSGATLEAGVRGQWRALSADLLLRHERLEGGETDSTARFNELFVSAAVPGTADAWQLGAGRRIVAWDVGYAWRPNDVVQQELRRTLLGTTQQGRPVLQLDHFGAATAWSLVWANPHHLNAGLDRSWGSEESALALRVYRQHGALDIHGFARWGEHTRGGVGLAVAWVASEGLELHGSWHFAQAHDGWRSDTDPADPGLQRANPWQQATLGAAQMALAGLTWTGAAQWSLLAEAWHDGSAPADSQWRDWQQRTDALSAAARSPGAPPELRPAYAGNLAWQATPWLAQNLRRDNLFMRLSWQHGGWQPAMDVLLTPADGGRTVTASLAWQGDRLRLEAGLRQYGGPADALLAQLPLRRAGYLMATHAF